MPSYTPAPIAEEFILDDRYFSYIVGPVGSGKTTASLMKIAYRAQMQAPSPIDGIRRTRWVIVRNTNDQLRDTTIKSWFMQFPPGEAGEWVATNKTFWLRFGDVEAEVMFRPLDNPDDVRRVLSLEITGAVVDEFVELPKEIIESLSARCGRYPPKMHGGPTWWGMWGASNPGNEDNWWYSWLYNDWEDDFDGSKKKKRLGYYQQPSGYSPHAENVENLPGGQEKYYTEQAYGKSMEWIKQFIEVQWGYSLKGKPVYRTFNPALHVATTPLRYNPHLPLIVGFDPGFSWSAAILGQIDSHGRISVLAELIGQQMGAQRFCREKLKPLLALRFPGAQLLISADPASKSSAQTNEQSVYQVLKDEMKVPVRTTQTNLIEPRLAAVEEFLCRLTDVGPALLIDPSCVTLIRAFKSGYRYAVSNKGQRADAPEKNEYSHPSDACQYMVLAMKGEAHRDARRRVSANIGFGNFAPNPYAY